MTHPITVGAATVPARYCFASRHHPGEAPPAPIFARALTGPLSFSMLVVMIAATASVLLGVDPLGWVMFAVPAALALATGFTVFVMRRTPAELLLLGDRAAIRSVWDVATGVAGEAGPLLPPKRVRDGIHVGIGENVLTFTAEDWPELRAIEAALDELVPPIRDDNW